MAQPSGSSEGGFPLKLLVDEAKKKVIFAEAGKELVDFFFSLMLLPIGAAISLVGKETFTGSLGELHDSISKLDTCYFTADPATVPSELKEELMRPPLACARLRLGALHLPYWKSSVRKLEVYRCYGCDNVSEVYGAKCPFCSYNRTMNLTTRLVPPSAAEGGVSLGTEKGFVKELVPYAITDDLSIAPLSTFSSLAFMKRLKVNDIRALQERTVMVGVEQARMILDTSLRSKTVLSDVFLPKHTGPE